MGNTSNGLMCGTDAFFLVLRTVFSEAASVRGRRSLCHTKFLSILFFPLPLAVFRGIVDGILAQDDPTQASSHTPTRSWS